MLPNKNELAKRYAALSNDQLLEILYQKEDYTPEALEVAQAEISTRQIVPHELNAFTAEKEAYKVFAATNALIPLSFGEKLFFFFGWFIPGFLTVAFRLNYGEDGLEMKLRQSRFFRIAGFISLLLTGFISVWLEISDISSYALFFVLLVVSFRIAPAPPNPSVD